MWPTSAILNHWPGVRPTCRRAARGRHQPCSLSPPRMRMKAPLIVSLALLSAAPAWAAPPSPEAIEFFEKRVRSVLVEHCYACHGPKKQKASLRLDSEAALLKGGESGKIVIPGEPDKSLLIRAVRHEGDTKMPEKKLPDDTIAALATW